MGFACSARGDLEELSWTCLISARATLLFSEPWSGAVQMNKTAGGDAAAEELAACCSAGTPLILHPPLESCDVFQPPRISAGVLIRVRCLLRHSCKPKAPKPSQRSPWCHPGGEKASLFQVLQSWCSCLDGSWLVVVDGKLHLLMLGCRTGSRAGQVIS